MKIEEILQARDLSGQNFSGMSLGGCDLSGKNLRGADLSYAHLGGAILRGTDLRNANLHQANLGAADLTGADLRYADLRETNLKGAILVGADLRECMGLKQFPVMPHYSELYPEPRLEETEDFANAQQDGYFPISHWGSQFSLMTNNRELQANDTIWCNIKDHLGELIFGDRTTYKEVRLVRQYKHYSQWAYMISKKGFEQMVQKLGLSVKPK